MMNPTEPKSRVARSARIALVAGFAAILAFLALRTSPYLQYVPWMPRQIGVWADHHGVSRNAAAFFVFGLAAFLLIGTQVWRVFAVAGFATALEVAQLWIPGRTFDWRDIVASLAGLALAWPVAWAVRRRLRASRC